MSAWSRILVVPDPKADTQPALERAVLLARAAGARLDLMACDYDDHLAGKRFGDSAEFVSAREALGAASLRWLDGLAAPLRESGLTVECHAVFAHPLCQAIMDMADNLMPDLIVKDTHYHAPIKRALFSNTDWELIRLCRHSLLLVKPHAWAAPLQVMAAVDPLHDADEAAALDHAILAHAGAIAELIESRIHAVHTYTAVVPTAVSGYGSPAVLDVEDYRRQIEQYHRTAVEKLLAGHAVDSARVEAGIAHRTLVEIAREIEAGLVIVGAVSRAGLKRRFIGHTARHMLERLPCDLLIVKGPDFT